MKRCQHCTRQQPPQARTDARFCSATCRSAHWQRRTRTSRALVSRAKCDVCGKRIVFGTRADARYCSARCRQRAHRSRKVVQQVLPAHQRLIREQLATTPRPAVDIGTARVREISRAEAKAIIVQYEWLGSMPAVTRHCYGIFFDGELGGVVVYGDEAGENLGVWERYGFAGKIIALARGAFLPWAHPHAASKLVRGSMRLLPERYTVVTATVDGLAGEVGTIYQACGFDYVGTMRQGGRTLIRVNGKTLSERTVGRLAGTQGARALSKLGFDASLVPRRARYFAFRGDKRTAAVIHLAVVTMQALPLNDPVADQMSVLEG